jgi:hypothetical protein
VLEVRAAVVPRVRTLPAWAWVAGIVVCSALFRYALTRRVVAPWIMVDELIYSELAKSFAESGSFLVRERGNFGVGVVYPALISPAWRLFGAVPDAYAAAKAINSVLMSLAAVPAYLLARRLVSQPLALLAALLTVAVPSMVYTGTLMTENAFYPVFLTCVWLLVLVLERPSPTLQVAVLAAVAVAFLTRAQAVALVPAIALAPPLFLRYRREPWRALLAWRWLYGLLAAGVVGALALQAIRGRSLLGAYQATTGGDYTVGGTLRWGAYHLGELSLYVGVAPLAAFALLVWLAPRLPREQQAFVAAALPVSVLLVLEVALFASVQVQRIEERNMFYVAPLLLIALLAWIEVGMPRPRAAGVATVAAVALVGAVPFAGLINGNAAADTLAFLPFWTLQDTVVSLGDVAAVAVVGAIVLGATFLLVPRRLVLVLPAAVLVWFGLTLAAIETNEHGGTHHLSLQALFGGTTRLAHPDWIDRQVGRDADVAFVWTGSEERKFSLWTNEFFNRSIGPVYDVGGAAPGGLPSTAVTVEPRTGVLLGAAAARYALTDTSMPLAGTPIGADERRGLVLYRAAQPLRLAYRIEGVAADGWSGAQFTVRRYDCHRILELELTQDPKLFPAPQRVTVGERSFRVSGTQRVLVTACGSSTFHVRPVRSPGPQDPRLLGLRVAVR